MSVVREMEPDKTKNEFYRFCEVNGVGGGIPDTMTAEDVRVVKTRRKQEIFLWFSRRRVTDPVF